MGPARAAGRAPRSSGGWSCRTQRARRGSPDHFGFEGSGDEARRWLDAVYGTNLRLSGPLGGVRHERADHGVVAFDHIRIDAAYSFDSDPMPMLVVVDVLSGVAEYVRDGITDRVHDGDSVLVSGWDMPFTGSADHPELRTTSLSAHGLFATLEEADPEHPAGRSSSPPTPRTRPAAGARWRATVDQVSSMLPADATPEQEDAAARLLGHTLLHTFPNNVVVRAPLPGADPRRRGRLALDGASRRPHHRGPRRRRSSRPVTSPASAT